MVRVRGVVFCLAVLVGSVLSLPAQQAIVSPAPTDSNSLQSNSARLISFSDTLPGQSDGALTVTFALYSDEQGTAALWTETQVVQITDGKYTALLGSTDPNGIPAGLFAADQPHWLAVQANGVEERHLLVSVPYAMKAVEAERFGGLLPSQYVTLAQLQTILGNSAAAKNAGTAGGTQTTTPIQTAAATGTTPQPATDFTDNNTSEVLLVTQQGTGYAIHAISSGDAAMFAENSSTTGTAMKALESSTTGSTVGLLVQTASPDGIPGVFDNTSGNGQILSLRSNGAIVVTMSAIGATGNINATGTISGAFSGDGFGLTNIPNSATTATSANSNNAIVARDQFGGFSAGQVQALNFVGSGFGLTNIPPAAVGATSSNIANAIVARDQSGSFIAGQIFADNFVGSGFGLTNIPPAAVGATSSNIANAIVARDQSGGFIAGQIFADNFVGNGFGLTNIPPAAVGATSSNVANAIVARDSFGNFVASQIFASNFVGAGFGLTNIPNSATSATEFDLPNAIVARDAGGGFNAGFINASSLKVSGPLTNTGLTDFSASQATLPVQAVLSANTPASCQASKELLIKTDAPAGQQLFICNATGDGYVLVGDGTAAGVTGLAAGDGSVAIGGTAAQPTIAVASGGITSDKLAPNAVTSVSIADGSLSPSKITGTAATLGSNSFFGTQSMPALNVTGPGSLIGGSTTISASTSNSLTTISQTGTGTALTVTNSAGIGINVGNVSGPGVTAGSKSSFGVFGSSTSSVGVHGEGAIGVEAITSNGTGLLVSATASTGSGIPVVIGNAANGKLISGRLGTASSFSENFSVDTSGNILAAGALFNRFPFFGSLTFNSLVRLAPGAQNAQIIEMSTADTSGAIGIVTDVVGTQAEVAYQGIASCNFDFNTPVNPGDYVGISPTSPGYCRDLGNTYPSDGRQVVGKVAGPVLAQAVPVMLFGPEQRSGTGGTLTTINTGAGLTGGPITSSGTISIANGGVTNSMLQNNSVTINPGVGLNGGGIAPLGGSVTLNNTGALSFNGRTGDILPAAGDYSFSQIAGTATVTQLPPDIAYKDQSNTFAGDQTIQGNLSTSGNVSSTGSITATSASINGSANASSGVMSVTDNGAATSTAAFAAMSQNNLAGVFLSSGPTILEVGTSTHGVLSVSSTGATVTGALTATSLSGDGSALSNVTASKIGSLGPADIATAAALSTEISNRQTADTTLQSNITAETTARQSDVAGLQTSIASESNTRAAADASLQASISAETTARQSDVANLQTSINNVSGADAKLAASNTFTAGTQDFSGAGATLPVRTVLSANTPASCVASKELLIKSDAPAGQQLFICDASGTSWSLVGDGASGGVSSFNGRSGSVTPVANDYAFSQISGSLAESQLPALTGDVTAAAGTGFTLLAPTGVKAGAYTKVHVDLKGRVVVGEQASFADLLGSASQTQLPVFTVYNNQANTFTVGQTVNATMTANLFSGNGSGLSNVNAATLNGVPSSGFAQLSTANTFTAPQTLAPSTSVSASLNIPPGSLPNAPVAGDIWNTGGVLQYRDNLSTNRALVSTTQSGGLQLLKLSAAITPVSVGSQSCSEQNFSVSGISTGDVLLAVAQPSTNSPGNNIAIGGSRVSAANTVAIQFCNVSRNSSTPVSGTYTFALMR